jgi:hypothetical protein
MENLKKEFIVQIKYKRKGCRWQDHSYFTIFEKAKVCVMHLHNYIKEGLYSPCDIRVLHKAPPTIMYTTENG